GESKESSGGECPVCYDKFCDLEGAGRTLCCGHMPSPNQGGQLPLDPPPGLPREPQIFIISRYGVPLGEQDSILLGRSLAEFSEAPRGPSSTWTFCSRSRALLLITLIAAVAVVAMVAAILPWVLLVRKRA
ncbi:hypothetical protein E2I00_019997, partial [Balaenoptera physalus]